LVAVTMGNRTGHRGEARRGPRRAWKVFGRNRGAVIGTGLLLVWVCAALLAPRVAPYDPLELAGVSRQPPSPAHLMGTDLLGRDVLSRIVYGARISLTIGLISVGIGLCVGALLGLVAGYYRGRVDTTIMRVVDALLAFPGLLLALVIIAALRPGLGNVMVAVGISSLPLYARLVRSLSLSIREREYVQAARALGGSDGRVMFRHVVPNLIGPVIVLSTLQIGSAILIGSALSYLGMGAQPPTPEWGLMTVDGQAYLSGAWWISTFPGLAIFSVVMGFNLMGDGVRAALDPRTAQERLEV
jgi:peptide/nickel transport system permease protein